MTFKVGDPKPAGSGRKKGVKNKVKVDVPQVRELLGMKGINPIEEIMKLLPDLRTNEQVEVWKWLYQYVEPKLSEQRFEKIQAQLENQSSFSLQSSSTEQLVSIVKNNEPTASGN